MKRIALFFAIITGIFLTSCSKKTPEFVNSIPDDAIAVVSIQPMKVYTKGKLNSLSYLKEKVKDEVWGQILDNPLGTGLTLDEYVFLFATIEEETPVLGFVAGIRDRGKFEKILAKTEEDEKLDVTENEVYRFIRPDQEGIIAWNEKQVVILVSPDEEYETSYWTSRLDWMFNPVKEESIVSMVDFNNFAGNMKDINMWVSSEDMRKVIQKIAKKKSGDLPLDLDMDLPINLTNNYFHVFTDFSNGIMNITTETNLSEEIQKNIDEVLVFKPSLNPDILNMAPGGDLLMALAVSMDLEKIQNLADKFAPPQLDEFGGKLEGITGVPTQTLLNALTGDFTLAVNALEGEMMVPVEVFMGISVNSDEIQELLMKQVETLVPVEDQGEFFVINIQGNEIYSGIVNNNWVITNMKGYKDKVKSGKLEKSLMDSQFAEFSDQPAALFLNLDMNAYPELAQVLIDQSGEKKDWIETLTGTLDYIGISGGGNAGLLALKTNKPNENSLYTLLRMAESED
jgi:hypothetical protein